MALALFGLLASTDVATGPTAWPALAAGLLFILAGITDFLDGYFARKWSMTSDFGRIADPVADKVIVAGSLIFLVSYDWATHYLPVWVVVVVLSREFLVSSLRAFFESRGVAFGADWDGKLKMIFQCCLIPNLFILRAQDLAWGPSPLWLHDTLTVMAHSFVWLTLVLSVSSGARYVLAARRLLAERPA
jgi:CDP-diacylglycerol--glycerol-3-phosphate 3-phosphatidyltransferase